MFDSYNAGLMKFATALKLLVFAAISTQLSAAQPLRTPDGVWKNPGGSVMVRTGACGDKLCGVVVWASPSALADARDSGTTKLIGTQLLRDYVASGPGRWTGQVYVPDLGGTYYSRIQLLGPDNIKVSGCILHGLICRSQIWTRV